MSVSLDRKGQTSFEVLMIAGATIAVAALVGAYYFGNISDQTTAIVILKAELLKELNRLDTKYIIVSSLEPVLESDGTLCFDVKTRPNDIASLPNDGLANIAGIISSKTKYSDPTKINIKLNDAGGC